MSKTAKRLHGKSNTACVFQGRNKNIQASSCLSFIMLLFKHHILCLACKRIKKHCESVPTLSNGRVVDILLIWNQPTPFLCTHKG